MNAARRLAGVDPALSRATYLDALSAAIFAGRLAGPGGGVLTVARAAAAAPPPEASEVPCDVGSGEGGGGGVGPQASDLLLDGMTAYYNEGVAAGVPLLRRSLTAFGDGAGGRTRGCAGSGSRSWPARCGPGTTSRWTCCPPGTCSWPAEPGR